nr:MAG TPA: hypothetical protein [Caudoviricetes sp.]
MVSFDLSYVYIIVPKRHFVKRESAEITLFKRKLRKYINTDYTNPMIKLTWGYMRIEKRV